MKQYLYTFNLPPSGFRVGCGYTICHGYRLEDSKFYFLDENGLVVGCIPVAIIETLTEVDHESNRKATLYESKYAAPVELEVSA